MAEDQKTYSLDEINTVAVETSPELVSPEEGKSYSLDEVNDIGTWNSANEMLGKIASSYGRGIAADFARIPGEEGQLLKELGEKGGAGISVPSFSETAKLALGFMNEKSFLADNPLSKALAKLGQTISDDNEKFITDSGLTRPKSGKAEQIAYDLGQGTASAVTALGLAYLTKRPELIFGYFGLRKKAQIFKEAEASGKSPEEASILSSLSGVLDGGFQAVGSLAFVKAASLHNGLTRTIVRAGEQALQGALQSGADESFTHITRIRNDDFRDVILRVGYATALGTVLGLTTGAITTGIEKSLIPGRLEKLGVPKEDVPKIIQAISEKVGNDPLVHSQVVALMEDEFKLIQENRNKSSKPLIANEDPAEDLNQEAAEPAVKEESVKEDGSEVVKPVLEIEGQKADNEQPQIIKELQELTAKINEFEKQGRGVPDSILKRQKSLMDTLHNLKPENESAPAKGLKSFIDKSLDPDLPKRYTEMQALKRSLQRQARAAADAELGIRKDLKNLKSGLVDLIKEYLPLEARGGFLSAIATAENGRDILKVVSRIEKLADQIQRKSLLRNIRKQADRIEGAKNIDIGYVQAIRRFLEAFELQKHAADIQEELQGTQDYLNSQRQQGIDVSLPQYVLNKLKILSRRRLDDIDTATLENIYGKIKLLADLGKTKLRARQALYEQEKKADLQELMNGSEVLKQEVIVIPKVTDTPLTEDQIRKNAIAKAVNKARSIDLSITPMDVVFDMLDGDANYTGPNFRIFKKTIDQATGDYLTHKFSLISPVVELAKSLAINESDLSIIGLYAIKKQKGGLEKLESLGYSATEIEKVTLTDNQKQVYDKMRSALDSLRPEISEVLRDVYNQELSSVKDYFPFMTDFDAMSDFEIRERFGNNVQEVGQIPRKNVNRGFTLKRTGGDQKIQLNAMEIFLKHVDNASYLIHVGEHTKRLGEIAKTSEYGKAVGPKGQEIVADWIDTVARKGRLAGETTNALDILRKNVGLAVLGFKLSSILIQPTSLLDGAGLIGADAFSGMKLIATDPEWRAFVYEKFPEIKARVGDDPAYHDFGGTSPVDQLAEYGFWGLKNLDKLTAASIAAGAYLKYAREKGIEIDFSNPDLEGVTYAELIVRRTQASAFFKDAPQAISRGKLTGDKSIDRLVLQFQTFMLNKWSLIKHDAYALGFKGGNTAQGVNIISFLVLGSIAETGSRNFTKEVLGILSQEDTENDDDGTFLGDIAVNILQTSPYISPLVSAFAYNSVPIPAVQYIRRAFDVLEQASRAKKSETVTKNAARAILLLSGLFGIPGALQSERIVADNFKVSEKSKRRFQAP